MYNAIQVWQCVLFIHDHRLFFIKTCKINFRGPFSHLLVNFKLLNLTRILNKLFTTGAPPTPVHTIFINF